MYMCFYGFFFCYHLTKYVPPCNNYYNNDKIKKNYQLLVNKNCSIRLLFDIFYKTVINITNVSIGFLLVTLVKSVVLYLYAKTVQAQLVPMSTGNTMNAHIALINFF